MQENPWLARIIAVTSAVAAMALVAMMLVTVADVALANLFKRPIIGAFDLVESTLIVSVFLGIPATFLRNGNIVVDVVDFFVSPTTVHRLKFLAEVATLVFLVVLLYNMVTPALDAYKFGGKKQELGLPLWVLWLPMLVGVLLAALAVLYRLVRSRGAPDIEKP
ncbi:MAG: TRAP transporter small permease [Casimicrobiaceae bacterium]